MSLKLIACIALVLGNYMQAAARLPVATTDVKKDLVAFAREHPDSLRATRGWWSTVFPCGESANRMEPLGVVGVCRVHG